MVSATWHQCKKKFLDSFMQRRRVQRFAGEDMVVFKENTLENWSFVYGNMVDIW